MAVEVGSGASVDRATIASLVWRRVSPGGQPDAPDGTFALWFAEWLHEHMDSHVPFVAYEEGTAAGIGWLAIFERVPGPGRQRRLSADIQSVYVLPERRNAGIGTALLAAMVAHAGTARVEHLTVHSSDLAIPLYV